MGGQLVKTMKFCDALNDDGTSKVARLACLITDLSGKVLVNRSRPHDDSSEEEREAPVCDRELAIKFENADALAYFPNKDCGGRKRSSEEEDGEGEDAEGGPVEQREGRRRNKRGLGRGNRRSDESSEEDSDEDTTGAPSERAPEQQRRGGPRRNRGGRRHGQNSSEERSEESSEEVITTAAPFENGPAE